MPPLNPPKRLQNVVEVIDLEEGPRKKTLRLPPEKRWKVLETREEAQDRYRAEALKELEEDRRQFETSIGLEPTASLQQFGEAVARHRAAVRVIEAASSSSSSSSSNFLNNAKESRDMERYKQLFKYTEAEVAREEAEDFFREGRA